MTELDPYRLLNSIAGPEDLQRLDDGQLQALAEQMRARIAEVVSSNGGHLASNLGVCEMTIALHMVFDFKWDRLLFDVGHQCYPHKLITGRGARFDTLRQAGGISGFPAPSESEYDVFATGHAGTAISTAVGLAKAADLAGREQALAREAAELARKQAARLEEGSDEAAPSLVTRWAA